MMQKKGFTHKICN